MAAYLLLALVTVALAVATRRVVRHTGDRSFLLGMAVLYAWTLLGAWFFIGDAMSGYHGYRIGLHYYYLMEKMFPFELDRDYLLALTGYGVFLMALLAGVLGVVRGLPARRDVRPEPWRVDHRVFFLFALAGATLSFLLVRPLILQAMAADLSIYQYTRHTAFAGATLHSLTNELACFALLLGWAIHLTARQGRSFTSHGQHWAGWAYPVAVALMSVYLVLLGNRHELFMALLLGVLLFAANAATHAPIRLGAYALAAALPLLIAGKVRDLNWSSLAALRTDAVPVKEPFTLPLIAHVPGTYSGPVADVLKPLLSNELFAAHFSLYGILRHDVPPQWGVSFLSLAGSMLPRALLPQRPPGAYEVYAAGAGLQPGQGYTIHQAAAWYLNAGWAGLPLGGALLGLCWGALLRLRGRVRSGPLAWRVFAVMGAMCWTAYLPVLVRNGPEAFKGLVFEGLLMPVLVVTVAAAAGRRLPKPTSPAIT
ncbi:MAG: hypothetical protein IT228_02610 [Flavobacteriales bacterium]|nr:hypothetical protein [Flavobacteriales bacterium]MCC6576210.1 hypothetical protein [Flavobacteriales bacterium]NUQ14976.1 hypothetical protein [Flavobacteriales bacterium]